MNIQPRPDKPRPPPCISLKIHRDTDIIAAKKRTRAIAETLGLNAIEAVESCVAAAKLSANLVRHANGAAFTVTHQQINDDTTILLIKAQ